MPASTPAPGHSLPSHAHALAHVPIIGPSVVPRAQAPVAPHQPQTDIAVQSPQVVATVQSMQEPEP